MRTIEALFELDRETGFIGGKQAARAHVKGLLPANPDFQGDAGPRCWQQVSTSQSLPQCSPAPMIRRREGCSVAEQRARDAVCEETTKRAFRVRDRHEASRHAHPGQGQAP